MKIKIGTLVKIINPEFLVRVGYPETVESAREKMEKHILATKYKSISDILLENFEFISDDRNGYNWCIERIKNTLAREFNSNELNFGGKERKIYTRRIDDLQDIEFTIKDPPIRKVTGTYVHACGGYDYYGEYDYEPAYLEGSKHHIFYKLNYYHGGFPYLYPKIHVDSQFYNGDFYIEKCNLEIIE